MLSSVQPHPFNERQFHFSRLFLKTGPVLIVKKQVQKEVIEKMMRKEIAVDSRIHEALLIEHYPEAIVRFYDIIPEALNEVVSDRIDGAIVNYIPAISFVQDLYKKELKIASLPLDNTGLRMVALKDKQRELMKIFNEGLDTLKREGVYEKLALKWGLYPEKE